jgi:hypothetical protein
MGQRDAAEELRSEDEPRHPVRQKPSLEIDQKSDLLFAHNMRTPRWVREALNLNVYEPEWHIP